MNATLKATWSNKTVEFPVFWGGNFIEGEERIAEVLFSDRKKDPRFAGCLGDPDLDIILDENPKIKSQVHSDDIAGELMAKKNLRRMLLQEKKKEKERQNEIEL
jgi:hypothetical protein